MKSSSPRPLSITPRGLHCKKPPIRRSESTVYSSLASYLGLLQEWRLWKQLATDTIHHTSQSTLLCVLQVNRHTSQINQTEFWHLTRQSNIKTELRKIIQECGKSFASRNCDFSSGCSVLFWLDKRVVLHQKHPVLYLGLSHYASVHHEIKFLKHLLYTCFKISIGIINCRSFLECSASWLPALFTLTSFWRQQQRKADKVIKWARSEDTRLTWSVSPSFPPCPGFSPQDPLSDLFVGEKRAGSLEQANYRVLTSAWLSRKCWGTFLQLGDSL